MGGRVGSIQAGADFLDNSVRPTGTGGEVGAVGTCVAGNLAAEPRYPVRICAGPARMNEWAYKDSNPRP